ncbi:hypothetical protein AUP74_01951 [Microbulbifer aggregans]|uniref:Uncharacterized protein n=1 Tax=Microbulbifer aggregans TaxID=1769779 RepID=A0A1C9W8A0_9GAMM|nr:hypothetical protein [Microbulbifer aggregans]AOS97381.1 hypothetical protein AUP74_01951 [Microbulbifer aggregans]
MAGIKWIKNYKVISCVISSIGVALLAILVLVSIMYSSNAFSSLRASELVLIGLPLLVYAVALLFLARLANTSLALTCLFGMGGLLALYHLGGAVLMLSICSFDSRGC